MSGHPVTVAYASLGGIAGVLVLVMGTIAALTRQPGRSRRVAPADESAALREKIDLLEQENALLRSEQQRPLSLGKAAGSIRESVAQIPGSTDEDDEAWGALTEATVLRATLVTVCRDLQTAINLVQTQLTTGIPSPELDRRAGERNGAATELGVPGGGGQA